VIVRALGMAAEVVVDVSVHALAPGDLFLLTTRGLWLHHDDDPSALRDALIAERSAAASALVTDVADLSEDNVTALSLERA
jgi:serine/threonine protein phosphatase PrpC